MTEDFEVLERRVVFEGFVRVVEYRLRHRLPDGTMGPEISREVFQRADAVAVLPYDPARDRVVLVEQFRTPIAVTGANPWSIEPPAGIIDDGEDIEACGRREVLEEAGLTVGHMEPIARYFTSPGGSTEMVHLYCGFVDASEARHGGEAHEQEWTRPFPLPFAGVPDFLASARCDNAVTRLSLMWLLLNRDRLLVLAEQQGLPLDP